MNPFKVLKVEMSATSDEVKASYRRRVLELHPDKVQQNGGSSEDMVVATEATKHIHAAYAKLKTPFDLEYQRSTWKKIEAAQPEKSKSMKVKEKNWKFGTQAYKEKNPLVCPLCERRYKKHPALILHVEKHE